MLSLTQMKLEDFYLEKLFWLNDTKIPDIKKEQIKPLNIANLKSNSRVATMISKFDIKNIYITLIEL